MAGFKRGYKDLFRLVLFCAVCLPSLVFGADKTIQAHDQKITFNFVDVDLPAVTKFVSEITKKNFIFDERLKGKITIIAPSRLSVEDAFALFTSVLELKGFTIVPSGVDAYKIIPSSEAKQKGMEIMRNARPVNESYIARMVPLKNISSEDALRFLQPVVSRDGYVSAFGPGNLLLIIDSGLNMEKILSIVDSIDQPSLKDSPELVLLKYSSADAVAKIINDGMGHKIRGAAPQPLGGDETKAVADQRLNGVVLFGDKGVRESMKSLIALLDIPSPETLGRLNVYFLENADAVELAKVLDGIVKGVQPQRQAAPGGAPVTPFEAAGGITVSADKASNALIVVASPSDYQSLLQVIKQLDTKRRQVYVEAMIIEATIDRLKDLGAQWRMTAQKNGNPIVIGGFGTMNQAALQSVLMGLQGATVGGMGNFLNVPVTSINPDGTVRTDILNIPGYAALFSLNEFKDAINVLSTPQLLTSDNKEAEIVVGENVPFISKREADPTRTVSVFSTIERKDVGITLKLTPQITEGDYVKLDIYQEISALKQNQTENILVSVGPTTTKRSTRTSVFVKDEQTVVIGGLMQDRDEEITTKMPLLGDIPLLGWAFKNKSHSKTKTNLLVFLTPHIVKESRRLAMITQEKRKEFSLAENETAEGEILLKFRDGVEEEKALEIISSKGAEVITIIKSIGVYHIRLQKGQSVEDGIKAFTAVPDVQYAEPNYKVRLQKQKQ